MALAGLGPRAKERLTYTANLYTARVLQVLASVKLSAQNIFTVQHPYWYVVVSDRDSESVMVKVPCEKLLELAQLNWRLSKMRLSVPIRSVQTQYRYTLFNYCSSLVTPVSICT